MGHFGKCHNTFCFSPQILHKQCVQVLKPTMVRVYDFITKLRRANRTSGALFYEYDFSGNLSVQEILVMTSCTSDRTDCRGAGGRQDSLWGRECSGNFPLQEIAWQQRNPSREAERGEEEKISMKSQSKAERNRAKDKTLIYNGRLAFR